MDGDPHLYMLYVGDIGNAVVGLFFSKDEFSSYAHEFSNEHEMFYLNADTVNLDDSFLGNTLAHEFQHMVHWNLDRNEDTWITEGYSELTEHLLGFEVGGFDYLFSLNTDIPILDWPSEPGAVGKHYGGAFLFMTYIYDRFGPEGIRMIAQNPANGLRALDDMLAQFHASEFSSGVPITVEDLFLDWGISLVLQDPAYSDGHYGLRSYQDAPQAQFNEQHHDCPFEEQYEVSQFGFDFILVDCEGEFELDFSGETTTKIISPDPGTGEFVFWSNKGDSSDMRLTRSFDFRNTTGPIEFEYRTWYHIEEDYDYVYLEASIDGGDTWNFVSTPSGTTEDPSGNSYGWGYNGTSGNRNSPEWITERVDLSAYSGREVMLRFEYITDTAVNTEGFLLDDLRIDAIGYEENFEGGDGGWRAEGFARIHNLVPQTFKLAIIERGTELRIRKIEVDTTGKASIPLSFDSGVEDVILVVTGTTRYSWMPATYSIEIRK